MHCRSGLHSAFVAHCFPNLDGAGALPLPQPPIASAEKAPTAAVTTHRLTFAMSASLPGRPSCVNPPGPLAGTLNRSPNAPGRALKAEIERAGFGRAEADSRLRAVAAGGAGLTIVGLGAALCGTSGFCGRARTGVARSPCRSARAARSCRATCATRSGRATRPAARDPSSAAARVFAARGGSSRAVSGAAAVGIGRSASRRGVAARGGTARAAEPDGRTHPACERE